MIREGLQKLVQSSDLTADESEQIMNEIMSGQASNSQTAAFLTALKMKGETVEELIAFAQIMKKHCHKIQPKVQGRLVDTCGTGGDKIKTFNVSTASAFVIAGAGVAVAKHGNRAVSSKSGSADVLEKLGINLNMEPKAIQDAIEKVGVGFMFAPAFHPAMKFAAEPRREIGFRTIFNLLGPLTNPASANAQLLGVYDSKLTVPIAQTLKKLECEEAMIVHGLIGLDEISTIGKTVIAHLKNDKVSKIEMKPSDFGVKKASVADLKASTSGESAKIICKILSGKLANDPKVELVLVNSAAGIILGGKAQDFNEGMTVARESIESGAALKKLKALVEASGGNKHRLEGLETGE